jgi:hypothetical protein
MKFFTEQLMGGFASLGNHLKKLLSFFRLDDPNVIFYIFLTAFVLDSVLAVFFKIPVFVGVMIVFLPFLLTSITLQGKEKWFFVGFFALFILTGIFSGWYYIFDRKNISDVLFILVFATSYYFYRQQSERLSVLTPKIFFIVALMLFGATFAGYNSLKWMELKSLNSSNVSGIKKTLADDEKQELNLSKSKNRKKLKQKAAKPADTEVFRHYRNGLFRLPHVAAYFFGFLFIYFGYQFQRDKQKIYLFFCILAFGLMFFTGVRTWVAVFAVSLILYAIQRRYFKYAAIMFLVGLVFVLFREALYAQTKETFIGQFFSLLITATENFTRLSRMVIWKSWWLEMNRFSFENWITGKGFYMSVTANYRNLNWAEWFHNDFLSIIFSYGIIGFAFYAGLFVRIFRDNKDLIMNNVFLFTFYFTMLFAAFFNGMYYYFPILLMFLFVKLLQQEREKKCVQ